MNNNVVLRKSQIYTKISGFTILILILLVALALSLTSDTFLSYNNIYSLIYGVSIQFFAIIGFTYLLILGEIDLSVGAVYGISGTIVGALMQFYNWKFWPSMIVSLIICTMFGYMIGQITVKLRLNSMMVTLGTMTLVKGLNSILFNKISATIYPAEYRNYAKFQIAGIHWTIIAAIVIIIVLELMLHKTTVFKELYFVGSNNNTAKIYGIKADRIKSAYFAVSSFTAAFAGIIATSRITHSDIATGEGLEFTLITAAVVGGASLIGGKGSILKSALGLLFLALLLNGMIIYRIEPFIQQVAVGIILILSVFFDARMNKKKM